MNIRIAILLFAIASPLLAQEPAREQDSLDQRFSNPPRESRPSGYWWWLYNNVDKASITRDLEEFNAKGTGAVLLVCSGNWGAGPTPSGPEFLSDAWRDLFVHALDEAERLNIKVDVNMAPGWNMGGPWITPDKASRWFLQSEITLQGPKKFHDKLPLPEVNDGYCDKPEFGVAGQLKVTMAKADYRDTSVVAFRVPDGAQGSIKNERADIWAKSARTDGNVWTGAPADKVMADPRQPWKNQPGDVTVAPGDVVDLTGKFQADGALAWDVPEGSWVVVRTGHRKTGAMMVVPLPGKEGLENDFLDRAGVDQIFDQVGMKMVKWAGRHAGKTLRAFCEDSFEAGYPNWTARMPEHFRKYRGYDMTPYLPVLRSYIVGSAEISERFLHDYRKTIADCMADEHFGRFGERAAEHGMVIRAESAGPSWSATICMDGLKNLGRVAFPQGEFWLEGFITDGQNRVGKMTASAAHIYGHRTASAEAFTSACTWSDYPALLKPIGDRAFCEGINDFVFHTMTAQRPQDGKPGYAYGAGSHFNPNVTWWNQTAKSRLDYVNRCQALLQSGTFVADVLYYNGDWVPNLVAVKRVDPSLGKGYDYDVCNEEVLLTRLSVRDGKIVLPDGMNYRLLVLPEETRMPAPVAKKLAELVKAGATVVGPRPVSDPGLLDHPRCDQEVRKVADELWGDSDGQKVRERKTGAGRVIQGRSLREILSGDGVPPDFAVESGKNPFIDFIHRRTADADFYFICNRNETVEDVTLAFRQSGKQPEWWDAVTGKQRDLPEFRSEAGRTKVPMRLGPHESGFMVFRKPAAKLPGTNILSPEPLQEITGEWTVRFDREWFYPVEGLQGTQAEGQFIFTKLDDWSQRPEPAIHHFSGTAVYHKIFELAQAPAPDKEYFLELGKVSVSAKVKLNGRDLGVVWCAPWRIPAGKALQKGKNQLEIEVVNCWPNRLIGDGLMPKEQRRTNTNLSVYEAPQPNGEKQNIKLLPSGLHGPVRLTATQCGD